MNPIPPYDMQSSEVAYRVFYALFTVQLLGALIWIVWQWVRTRSALPIAAFAGALPVGYFLPAVCDHLLLVWFPANVPLSYLSAFGMKQPLFEFIGYALYFGLGGYVMMRALEVGKGSRAVIGIAVIFGIADLLYELPFLAAGMYTYYGYQPFAIHTFPMHWLVMNASVPVVTGFIMYCAKKLPRTGRERTLAVFMAPALGAGALFIPMVPVAIAMHSDAGEIALQGASLLAIAICIAALFYIARWAATISAAAKPGIDDVAMADSRHGR